MIRIFLIDAGDRCLLRTFGTQTDVPLVLLTNEEFLALSEKAEAAGHAVLDNLIVDDVEKSEEQCNEESPKVSENNFPLC